MATSYNFKASYPKETNNTQKVTYRLNKKGVVIAVPIIKAVKGKAKDAFIESADEFLKKSRKKRKPMSLWDVGIEGIKTRRKKRTLLNKNK
tara:strand:+ start:268 stop:540 length:273 start_codon:yes stop_codon:yes gene_type:complete